MAERFAIRTGNGRIIRGLGAVTVTPGDEGEQRWRGTLVVPPAAPDVVGEDVTLIGADNAILARATVAGRCGDVGRLSGQVVTLSLRGTSELDGERSLHVWRLSDPYQSDGSFDPSLRAASRTGSR
jgi:hypothetical protein